MQGLRELLCHLERSETWVDPKTQPAHSFLQQMFVKHQLCTPLPPGWNHPLHGLNHQHAEVPPSDFSSKLYTWTASFLLVNPAGCLPSQQVISDHFSFISPNYVLLCSGSVTDATICLPSCLFPIPNFSPTLIHFLPNYVWICVFLSVSATTLLG